MLLNNNDIMIYNKSLIFLFIIVPDYIIIETFRFEDKNDYDDEINLICSFFAYIYISQNMTSSRYTEDFIYYKSAQC